MLAAPALAPNAAVCDFLPDDVYAKVHENRRDNTDQQECTHCYGAHDEDFNITS